jgi:hypothetical protein
MIMRLIPVFILIFTFICYGQNKTKWKVHDTQRPNPPIVTPGTESTPAKPGKAPSDAIVLFDGKDASQWRSMDGGPIKWKLGDGYLETVKGAGMIRTYRNFGDCQLHIEWSAPVPAKGSSQGRGNSGVIIMGRYEVQVLDCYENTTYADGQTAALYGQYPPMANACRPPGEWQSYDIIFRAPRFCKKGELMEAARITVFHNGVLMHHDREFKGPTGWFSDPEYRFHPSKLPLCLQDHGNPVRFRNIWIRDLSCPNLDYGIEVTPARKILDSYAGKYEQNIDIKRDQNWLVATMHGGREFILAASSDKDFLNKDYDIYISFNTDKAGKVESLDLTRAGGTGTMKRVE